jgi:hypothetical protein
MRDTLIRNKILMPSEHALVFPLNRKGIKLALGDTFPQFPEDGYALVIGRIIYRDLLDPNIRATHETRWVSWYHPGEEGDEVTSLAGIGLSEEYERYT